MPKQIEAFEAVVNFPARPLSTYLSWLNYKITKMSNSIIEK